MYKQVYFPLTEYEQEYRYSYYLYFLVRVIYKDERYTGINKQDFIKKGVEAGMGTSRHLKNVWEKGAYKNKFFNIQTRSRVIISLRGKKQFDKLVLIPYMTYSKVKSIIDFKLFITCLVAGKKSKNSKGRGYNNIANRIGTNYKETACRRVKKAESKFGLEKTNRYINYNGYLTRLTNMYYFGGVTYIYNKFYNSVNSSILKSKKALKNVHKGRVNWNNIIKKGEKQNLPYLPSEEYAEFNGLCY